MRIRRVLTAGTAAAGIMTSLLAGAPVASAQPAPDNCPGNSFCLYENNDYEGSILVLSTLNLPVKDLSGFRFRNGHPVNDNTSSVANKTNIPLTFFRDAHCKGESFSLPGGRPFSTVGLQNDSFTSIKQTDRVIGKLC